MQLGMILDSIIRNIKLPVSPELDLVLGKGAILIN
jgi:hypothetical protein